MEEKALLSLQEIYRLSHAGRVRNVISVKKSDSLPRGVDCRFRHIWIVILIVRPQPELASISQDLIAVLQVRREMISVMWKHSKKLASKTVYNPSISVA